MVICQNILGFQYELVTHIVSKLSDVYLGVGKTEFSRGPSVRTLTAEDPLFPELTQNSMCLDTFFCSSLSVRLHLGIRVPV